MAIVHRAEQVRHHLQDHPPLEVAGLRLNSRTINHTFHSSRGQSAWRRSRRAARGEGESPGGREGGDLSLIHI
eukprot:14991645-Alexandrium_andersonii.AAC.1